MKSSKTGVSASKLVNTAIDSEKTRQPAFFAEIGSVSNRRLYIIRRDSSDWTPIVALISGPKSPALSTMRTRFETLYHKPKRTRKVQTDGYALAEYTWAMVDYERNLRECGYAGDSVAEYFVDWLLKTDIHFQREPYSEVNL